MFHIILSSFIMLADMQPINLYAINEPYEITLPYVSSSDAVDMIASDLANIVIHNEKLVSDLDKVRFATNVLSAIIKQGQLDKYTQTTYGQFLAQCNTSAGAMNALGSVLEHLGFIWQPTKSKMSGMSWCVLRMDGVLGYADGYVVPGGIAGYGNRPPFKKRHTRVFTGCVMPFKRNADIDIIVNMIQSKYSTFTESNT